MYGIDNLQSSMQLSIEERQSQQRTRLSEMPATARREAVLRENKAAALDSLSLTAPGALSGTFSFEYSAEVSGSVEIMYEGEQGAVSYQANFSYGFKISIEGSVALNEGLELNEEALSGPDFEFTSDGVLKLFEELSARFNLEGEAEVDLAGELDGNTVDLLQRLGLLNEDGQTTSLLQLLSDYAGLDRFQEGQQVGSPRGVSGYGPGVGRMIPIAYGLINDLLANDDEETAVEELGTIGDEVPASGMVADDD